MRLFLIAESWLDQPTAFGIPLGTLILILLLVKMMKTNNNSPRQSSGPSESEIAATNRKAATIRKNEERRRKYYARTSRLEQSIWIIMVFIIPTVLIVLIILDILELGMDDVPLFKVIAMTLLFFGGGPMWIWRMNYVNANYQRKR